MDGEYGVVVDYTYDDSGNILSKVKRSWNNNFSSLVIGSVVSDITYSYTDSEWKDLLTTYGGQAITYDAIGNPLNYRDGITLTWQNGRELASYTKNSTIVTYTYDASGLRTSKNIGGVATINYTYEESQLLSMEYMEYVYNLDYDANGKAVGLFISPTLVSVHNVDA